MPGKLLDDMLMDVDTMNFINTDKNNDVEAMTLKVNDEDFSCEDSFLKDSNTGKLMMKLTSSDNDLPIKKGESGELHFQLGPISSRNMAFIVGKDNTKLYPVSLPKVDTSESYCNYIKKAFDIYDSLGDNRVYSIPTIGVINSSFEKEHIATINLAMETFITELENYIDSIKMDSKFTNKYLDLEDSLTIINCLKLMFFDLDTPNIGNIRERFIHSLLKWVNRSDGEPNAAFIEQIFQMSNGGDRKVFEVSLFWNLLNQLLLRGLFEQALGCIERSGIIPYLENMCEVSSNAIKDLVQLIQNYPMDSMDTFREWKALALELSQTYNDSETNVSGELRDHIEDTLLVISGYQNKITAASKTWYESFCGMILYYIPSLELAAEYLQLSLNANPLDVTSPWEQSCSDIINGDIYNILPILESLNTCTAAFTAALVEAKGLLENNYENEMDLQNYDSITNNFEQNNDIFSPRNGMASYMLMNFAFELCSTDNKDLWSVAIGLISLNPKVKSSCKRDTLSELLLHYPFQTNDDIEWMFGICARWKLPEVSRSLYTMLGSSMIYEGRTIEAMTNYSKAGKFNFVKEYSWTLFEAALLKGSPLDDVMLNAIVNNGYTNDMDYVISTEVLQNVVTNVMRQTLAPYAILYKFFVARDSKDWENALNLLMLLLNFQYLPKYYLVILIAEFLYPIFLLDDSKVIDDQDVLVVMRQMEDKWDSSDKVTKNIYTTLLKESDETLTKVLPTTLEELKKSVSKKLSFKLCQEFM